MIRYVVVGTAANIVCSLPLFLVGAMAVQIRADLDFGAFALGAAVSIFRLVQAAAASVLGTRVDRWGATASLRAAIIGAQVACAGIALFTASWLGLVGWMCLAAIAKSMAQPAANRLIVNNIPLRRRGTAVGLKQAASPLAAMMAGLAVPVIATTIGWRWAYIFVIILGVGVIVFNRQALPAAKKRNRQPRDPGAPLRVRGIVLLLTVAFATGNAASSTIPAFWVDFAVVTGFSPESAGLILAAASGVAIAARVLSGLTCDRLMSGHMRLCSALLGVGAAGFLGLAFAPSEPGVHAAISVLLAQGGAWGFSAALWYSALRAFPDQPGRITGILAVGSLIGSSAGPLVFGFIVETLSYAVAWGAAAALGIAASVGMAAAARTLDRPVL